MHISVIHSSQFFGDGRGNDYHGTESPNILLSPLGIRFEMSLLQDPCPHDIYQKSINLC